MISLDYTFSMKDKNSGGILNEELDDVLNRLAEINERLKKNPYPFMDLPDKKFQLEEMKDLQKIFKKKELKELVLLGIGGSALGAKAIFEALLPEKNNDLRYWILDNIDPYTVKYVLSEIEEEKTLLLVISKSGETAETLAQFMIFKERLNRLGDLGERTVIITDEKNGTLKQIAEKEGYTCLYVPKGVGGRFSVLSPVGLFPAIYMGIDIEEILDGAKNMAEHIKKSEGRNNIALVLSALLYLMEIKGKNIHVMMPYCDRLLGFSEWFRQLEAESLGKDGKGPTPIVSRGVTDQHSQLQLYIDGPKNKFLIFMYVPSDSLIIPDSFSYIDELSYLAGKSLEELFFAEFLGTKVSLCEASTPSIDILIEKISPFNLGALFYLFEMAITFFGELLEVNVFDQPAVEKGKIYTKAKLGKKGYEEIREQLESFDKGKRATVSF